MFKAICTDIDGTLLNAERELSKRTIDILSAIKNDVVIILASSRMPAAMRHLQQEIGITDQPLICYNGGYVITQKGTVKMLDSVKIKHEHCITIAAWGHKNDLHVSFYTEDNWLAPQPDQWTAREENNTKVKANLLSTPELIESWRGEKGTAHKVMCMGEPEKIDALIKDLAQQGIDLNLYRSKDTYLEIAPKEVSKATALNLLLEKEYNFGVKDVIAFGDNFNDIEMLSAVGCGVAVENAKDEVKKVADEITLTGKRDGVAVTLEKYFG